MDPRPADHHVHDLHLRVHPNMEAPSLPCMWEGKATQRNFFVSSFISNVRVKHSFWFGFRVFHQVVCQSCSSNKCYLEYLKNQLARVCDQCFLVLRQQNSTFFHSSSYVWRQERLKCLTTSVSIIR